MEPTTPSRPDSGPAAIASNAFTSLSSNWPDQLANGVESAVGVVRDKAVKPATTAARALVYGPVVAVVGLTALVLVGVAVVRGLNAIPGFRDWISLLALGGLFAVLGLFLLRRGRSALKTPR